MQRGDLCIDLIHLGGGRTWLPKCDAGERRPSHATHPEELQHRLLQPRVLRHPARKRPLGAASAVVCRGAAGQPSEARPAVQEMDSCVLKLRRFAWDARPERDLKHCPENLNVFMRRLTAGPASVQRTPQPPRLAFRITLHDYARVGCQDARVGCCQCCHWVRLSSSLRRASLRPPRFLQLCRVAY